mgnify:FL=1
MEEDPRKNLSAKIRLEKSVKQAGQSDQQISNGLIMISRALKIKLSSAELILFYGPSGFWAQQEL